MANEKMKKSVLQRLGTIKGHIAGIERMVEDDKPCEDILFQLSAVLGAVNKLNAHILEGYAQDCLHDVVMEAAGRQRLEHLTQTMIAMLKKS